MVNPNHNWELHTVDFNACLLALDNLDDGDGLIILSHDSGGCYLGIVQLLKQGFSGQCIAASIFVPENLSVESNRTRYIISEVRSQLRGTMLDSAALDRLFAVEYPEKNYVPAFQPKHGKTIAYRMEAWTDEALQLLLDSRCLFQPAYAPHRATLLIDARSGIICNGIDITHVPVVIPEPEPEPEIIQGPEVAETPEPEVVIIEETLQTDETGREGESGQDGNEGVEAAVGSSGAAELENRGSVSFSRELTGADDGVEVNVGYILEFDLVNDRHKPLYARSEVNLVTFGVVPNDNLFVVFVQSYLGVVSEKFAYHYLAEQINGDIFDTLIDEVIDKVEQIDAGKDIEHNIEVAVKDKLAVRVFGNRTVVEAFGLFEQVAYVVAERQVGQALNTVAVNEKIV